ncbi:MAG: hypothetical protein A3A94_02405 [Candidatus Portnoybacteria bacterium RIFCSPLOWO2_01_FULL_43_11]|uniref:Uncharacterized protein n=4 Tax=Candidatus Portnoyibacteriota TaxID=1817913 RepID=A0A1G2FB68_9BACT|nr:MAG: hypothetical protein A2815_02440 [Candidatus Portnoybacteria bacterium RIFCSPHIGHO2_01_FULL_40_12b]OGZ36204.1 MAG: hypothetical protein A3D38_00520 [Candidatus Portnoybacteria bacterium RIFCSPHIGHO2_02_FULL_40_23]OGZ38863.1 MAG: hypothetical protein A3A94_02405 [Candidatus Portnoybacteria bacterium RIFCSPLOWO2_01_FULL_43_11]OGZ39451.1 MAG: hypothetical protein A3E90_01635 [Candidatus Portnoybacteria bacterium RIFCSPHIGHO2_12_FULL_40_11]OGZ40523.1 MAG: hypothetical protein A3I20_00550 [C
MKQKNGEKMCLTWWKSDKHYSLDSYDYGEDDVREIIGEVTLTSDANNLITALILLTGITDADCQELTDPINEIITKYIKLVLEKQHQPAF